MAATQARPDMEFDDFNQDESPSTELAVRRDVARVVQEVQGAIIVAQRFRRNEDEARVKLLRACKRRGFAEDAEYKFPRGGSDVSGPSVQLAREAARVWGNIQYGFEIVAEDDVWRSLRAYAWDVETNSKAFQEDRFKKLIYRKKDGWVKPDERDLRELTNRRAAICYRNCILQVVPRDIIDEAIDEAKATLRNHAAADPDGERKRIMDAFANLNIMPSSLDQIVGHPVAECSPAEIADLRAIYKSIRDGNSTLQDYLNSGAANNATEVSQKTTERMTEIKERYSKGSEGANVGQTASRPPEGPESSQTPSSVDPGPQDRQERIPEVQQKREAIREQVREIENRRHGTKRAEPAQPLASPEGIFEEGK